MKSAFVSTSARLASLCSRLGALLILSVFFTVIAAAQSGSGALGGKVVDAANGRPLAGALVSISGTTLETSSDGTGEFYFGNVPAGSHTMHVSYLGLTAKDLPVEIVAGGRAELNPKMGDEVVTLQTFNVAGSRAGQAKALNLQRSSENLTEIVAADAIGKFPDQNAAETLQRLSGVALERDQGDGRFVSIRGLYADLNSTTVNGVTMPSSEAGTRRVNLDSIPTEMLDGIELTKALTPDMDGDAIGGSINLKAKTAYSSEGRIIAGSFEGLYNGFSKDLGHKGGITLADKFNQDRWGVLLSVSDQRREHFALDSEESTPWALKNNVYVPDGNLDIREYNVRRIRQGTSASLDFHPTKEDAFFLRGTYNHFSDTEHRFRELFRNTAATTTVIDATHGTVTNRPIQIDLKDRTEDNNFYNISAGGEHTRGVLRIDYLGAYAHAELPDRHRFEPVFQTTTAAGGTLNTSWNYDLTNPYVPVLTGAYQTAITPASFAVNSVRLRNALQQDSVKTAAINVRGDVRFGEITGYWKTGAKYTGREKIADTEDGRYGPAPAVTLANFYRPSSFRSNSVSPFITIDPVAFDAFFRQNPSAFTLNPITTAFGNKATDYTTDENVSAAYGMGSLTSGNLTVLGGVRGEQTDFKTKGWVIGSPNTAAQTFTETTVSRSYTNILPSLHLRYRMGNRAQVRASYTTGIARPNYGNSNSGIVLDDSTNTDTRGNPNLKPFHSDNFDLSFEYYPRALGVMSVGVFTKNIKDFIFTQNLAGQGQGGRDLVIPLNGKEAKLAGLEVTWQQQFTQLPSPFDGLGLYANATLNSSRSDYGAARPNENVPFSRQSKRISNVALSYEKYGFFLRVALNYRSPYIEDGGFGANAALDTWVDDHTQIDVSTNYQITRRVTAYAEFVNINREPYIMHWGYDGTLLRKAEYYKVNANFGVRFKY